MTAHSHAGNIEGLNDAASSHTTTTTTTNCRGRKRSSSSSQHHRQASLASSSIFDVWYMFKYGMNLFNCRCYEAFQSLFDLFLGVISIICLSPYLFAFIFREGVEGLTIPALISISKVPIIGPRFLSFIISLRSPYSSSIRSQVDSYYLASDSDDEPYSCEVKVSMSDDRSSHNAFDSIHSAAIVNLADFACTLCVLSITEKLQKLKGIRAAPSGLYFQLYREAKGTLATRMAFNMREVISELEKSPTGVLQQTLECEVTDAKKRVVARVGVKFSFDLSRKAAKRLYRNVVKASVAHLNDSIE